MALRNFRETTEEREICWSKTLAGEGRSRQWEKLPKNTPVKWPIYRMVGNVLVRAKKSDAIVATIASVITTRLINPSRFDRPLLPGR